MLEIVACRNRKIHCFCWLHLGQVSKLLLWTSKPNCTFKITQTIHLLSLQNMAIHFLISLKINFRTCCSDFSNSMLPTDHPQRLNPPISAPPPQAIKRKLVQKPSWAFSWGVVRPISLSVTGEPEKKKIKFKQNLPFSIFKIRTGTVTCSLSLGGVERFRMFPEILDFIFWFRLGHSFSVKLYNAFPIWPLKTSHSIQLFSQCKKKSSLKLWEISGRPEISWWLLVGV